ncbi:MAG: hypothetical protein ACPG31_14045, partial [Planctomycetota bacterium]
MKDLRDDSIPGNAQVAVADALNLGRLAIPDLRTGLHSEDWQQRLLSAVLMARIGCPQGDTERVVRILLTHLGDNRIRGDAHMAKDGLLHLGVAAYTGLTIYMLHSPENDQLYAREISRKILRKHPASKQPSARQFPTAMASMRHLDSKPGEVPPAAPELIQWPEEMEDLATLFRHALRDDAIRYNANLALGFLSDDAFSDHLQISLRSPDLQERRLAAALLMKKDAPPTDILLQEAVASLQKDAFGSSETVPIPNANRAAGYLQRHRDKAGPFLLAALDSSNMEERLRAAAILAKCRHPRPEAYVPVLLSHLMDNEIPDDATLAGRSLAE